MSADQLGVRMNVASMQAHRTLRELCGLGLVEIAAAGIKRSLGQRGVATTYRWLLSC